MRFRLDVDGEQRNIEVEPFAGGFVIRIEGASYRARTRLAKNSVDVRIGAKTLRLQLEGNEAILDDGVHRVRLVELSTEGTDVIESHPTGPGAIVDVRSSMPGRVVRVAVSAGGPLPQGGTPVGPAGLEMRDEVSAPRGGGARLVRGLEGEVGTADPGRAA